MIGLIVAYSNNRVIGNKGRIPWFIEGEQRRFRELTTGNVVIMGRRTYEEIGRPLPNRINIVISNTREYHGDNLYTAKSLGEALNMFKDKDIYIAGGSRLYEEALDIVDVMYITEVDIEVEGDTYFPMFDESKFDKTIDLEVFGEINYRYVTYTKKDTTM